MKTRSLFLSALACIAPLAEAQDPRPPIPVRQQDPEKAGARGGEETEAGGGDVTDDQRGPASAGKVEVTEPVIRNDLAFYLSPVLSFQPRRIAPGQSGEARLVLAMQRGAVLQVGDLDLKYPREQGPVELGEWTLGEPALGVEMGPFRGLPVYESYAHVVIPVAVQAGAEHGSYPILIDVIANVTDGQSGASRGQSRTPARADLVVGPPLPSPPVRADHGASRPDPVAAVTPPVDPVDDAMEAATGPAPIGAARVEDVATRPQPDAEGGSDPIGLPVDRGDRTLLWVGGGAGLLLLVVVLAALRRR